MLEKFTVYIPPFSQERVVRVYLPMGYHEAKRQYPVLYMHDGQNVFEDHDAVGGASLGLRDFLDKCELDVIVVAIDGNPIKEDRVNEYCPWTGGEFSQMITGQNSEFGGKGGAYIEFIVSELKPLIDRSYRTIEYNTAMAGVSLGGLISTYAACRYPEIFSKVAVLSSAFWRNQEEMEQLIKKSSLSGIEQFYLDCGTSETNDEWINRKFFESNQSIYELLGRKIENTRFEVVEGAEHHYSFFRKRVPDMMTFLFPDFRNISGGF